MSTAPGSCLGEMLADACLRPLLRAQSPCGDAERCVLLFQLRWRCVSRLVLDLCSHVSTYMDVILGFILAERAVRLNKKMLSSL